jgi:hypothetical protein
MVACSWNSLTRANGVKADESPQVYGTDLHNPAQLGIAAGRKGRSQPPVALSNAMVSIVGGMRSWAAGGLLAAGMFEDLLA